MAQCSKKTRLSVAVKRPEIRSHQNFPIPWEIPHLSSNSKMSREKKPCAKTCVGTGIEVLRAEPKKCSKIEYIYDNFICIYTHHTVNSTWKGFTSLILYLPKKATPENILVFTYFHPSYQSSSRPKKTSFRVAFQPVATSIIQDALCEEHRDEKHRKLKGMEI